jgi:hypothetical protein
MRSTPVPDTITFVPPPQPAFLWNSTTPDVTSRSPVVVETVFVIWSVEAQGDAVRREAEPVNFSW